MLAATSMGSRAKLIWAATPMMKRQGLQSPRLPAEAPHAIVAEGRSVDCRSRYSDAFPSETIAAGRVSRSVRPATRIRKVIDSAVTVNDRP